MKPLEALEDLRKDAKNHLDEHTKYLNDRLGIIEKVLIENERLKTSYLENLLNEESKEYIQNRLQALEVIIDYGVDVAEIMICRDYDQYEARFCGNVKGRVKLTKNKFDLLKKVLGQNDTGFVRISFTQRLKLGKLFEKYCKENNVLNCPESMATWLYSLSLLNGEKVKEVLKDD